MHGGFGGGGMHFGGCRFAGGGFRGCMIGSYVRSQIVEIFTRSPPDSIIDLAQWSLNYHERQRRRLADKVQRRRLADKVKICAEICIALCGPKFKSSVRDSGANRRP
jgi:hypothetical protein